jgi:hypothetical protein
MVIRVEFYWICSATGNRVGYYFCSVDEETLAINQLTPVNRQNYESGNQLVLRWERCPKIGGRI